MTKNPATPDYFIFSDGGNTRYAILRELWEETRDERFYRLTCYVKPWPGRLMCLLGHLAENDLQGKLSFIDRAKGIADARVLYEQESDQRLSLRTFSTLLDRDGYRLDSSEIQRMEYSLQYLYPVFPRLFDNGMGRPQARSLIRLHRALADSADSNPTIVDKDKLFTLFNATATQFDDPDNAITTEFNQVREKQTTWGKFGVLCVVGVVLLVVVIWLLNLAADILL